MSTGYKEAHQVCHVCGDTVSDTATVEAGTVLLRRYSVKSRGFFSYKETERRVCHVECAPPHWHERKQLDVDCKGCSRKIRAYTDLDGQLRIRSKFCSDLCRNRHNHRVKHEPAPCQQCDKPFTPKRSTAKFCSGACRVAAHRAQSR